MSKKKKNKKDKKIISKFERFPGIKESEIPESKPMMISEWATKIDPKFFEY